MTARSLARTAAVAVLLLVTRALGAQATRVVDSLRIDGSNGVMPLARAIAAAFQAQDPLISVVIGGGLGGRARLEALDRGSIDIALASHGLDLADLARQDMTPHRVAVTPVVFAVHPSVTVSSLTQVQVCEVFGGRTTVWSALGGGSLPVRPYLRPEAEVDTEVIRDGIGCLKGLPPGNGVAIVEATGDMVRALQETPGAIGVTTGTVVQQSDGRMRALAVDGVAPDVVEVTSGRYRLVRPAYLVTGRTPSSVVTRFLDFVRSERGQAVIRANGALPAL